MGASRRRFTRKQFVSLMRELLTELEQDHEKCTGTSAQARMSYRAWCDDLTALYENTRS